jgi:hypothetical protein
VCFGTFLLREGTAEVIVYVPQEAVPTKTFESEEKLMAEILRVATEEARQCDNARTETV